MLLAVRSDSHVGNAGQKRSSTSQRRYPRRWLQTASGYGRITSMFRIRASFGKLRAASEGVTTSCDAFIDVRPPPSPGDHTENSNLKRGRFEGADQADFAPTVPSFGSRVRQS